MSTARKIVVIGGGPAGVAAALAAKQQDAAAEVMLINDEAHEPYEKPPLSKAVLTGKVNAHDAPIAGPKGVAGSGVIFKPGTPVRAIDRESHAIVTNAGERIGYDALVLATGSYPFVPPVPGRDSDRCFVYRTLDDLDGIRAAAEEMGARYVVADATDPEKFEPAVQAAGQIDLVVHASGILGGTYARKQTFEQWRATMSANLDSCFVVTSAVLPRMKEGSRFVFISSSAAHEPMRARTAYSASKAGMNAFALALAQEVDRDGINVHIVTPGPVETDMLQDVPFEMYAIRASDVAEAVAWLDTVDPSVDLPEIRLHAITRGPAAREPVVPIEVERRAAKS